VEIEVEEVPNGNSEKNNVNSFPMVFDKTIEVFNKYNKTDCKKIK